jgi:hypothetical protein
MSLVLSWHGSEVQRIQDRAHEEGTVRIVLSAAFVLRHTPGEAAAVWGYLKPLDIVLSQARCEGDLADCMGSLSSGELYTGEPHAVICARQLALPWRTTLALRLTLQFHNGCSLTVYAKGASCEPGDGAHFFESYAC